MRPGSAQKALRKKGRPCLLDDEEAARQVTVNGAAVFVDSFSQILFLTDRNAIRNIER
jgi:hypothetical protein